LSSFRVPSPDDSDDRPFLSLGFRFGGLIDVGVMLALASTWIGGVGAVHWFFDLFDHFRLQYCGVCLLALPWFGWRRRWWLLSVAGVSLLMNAWPIARTTWVAGPAQPRVPSWELKVVCFNVLTSNGQKDQVVEYLRHTGADVIVALEVNKAWERALKTLEPDYPHHLVHAQPDNFGLGVFSRVEWHGARFRTFAHEEVLSFTATLVHDQREMLVVATHPLPPMNAEHSRNATAQLEAISRFVGASGMPALVVGDLNATPWSRAVRALKHHAPLDFRTRGAVWKPTWMSDSPLMLPLDHALCTAPLVIERRTIGPNLGSDHRAQEILLHWQAQK
jgi:endonuclease/exonuclease/phosphatase (EEP) superfamily protein YafD